VVSLAPAGEEIAMKRLGTLDPCARTHRSAVPVELTGVFAGCDFLAPPSGR
jgi:hypothetical protein